MSKQLKNTSVSTSLGQEQDAEDTADADADADGPKLKIRKKTERCFSNLQQFLWPNLMVRIYPSDLVWGATLIFTDVVILH